MSSPTGPPSATVTEVPRAGGEIAAAPDSAPGGIPGPTLACFAVLEAALLVLVVMVLTGRANLWFDEAWYLVSVPELHRLGLSSEFLRGLPGPAGPTYAVVHAVLEPLTGLRPMGVRLATIGMAGLTFLALGWAMRLRGVSYAFPKAVGLLAAPMAWGPIGTAMTEIPALFFFCASLPLLLLALGRAGRGAVGAPALGLAAGLACGASIAGRQYFLVAPLAALVLWRRDTWPVVVAYIAGSAAVAAPIFLAWGGLVPPNEARISGLSLAHGVLSYSYAGFVYCIYDARWLLRDWAPKLAVIAAAVAVNVAFGFLKLVPFLGAVQPYLSPVALTYYARAGCGVMLGFGLLFVVHLARMARERRDDRFFLFMCASSVLLLATPAKNAELFLGRYIMTALPLLVMIGAERGPDTYGKAARLALGCLGGAISLTAYLYQ